MKEIKLNISPNFTLEDIRKIRDYDYEMTKNMTREERSAYYDKICKEAMDKFRQFKEKYVLEEKGTLVAAEQPFEYKTKN